LPITTSTPTFFHRWEAPPYPCAGIAFPSGLQCPHKIPEQNYLSSPTVTAFIQIPLFLSGCQIIIVLSIEADGR
jgi:hypothetical protein